MKHEIRITSLSISMTFDFCYFIYSISFTSEDELFAGFCGTGLSTKLLLILLMLQLVVLLESLADVYPP